MIRYLINSKILNMKNYNINIKNNHIYGGREITIENKDNNVKKNTNTNIFIKLITGVFIGFINGFFGGGGGMVCVPLLLNAIKLPEKKAHATTLLIMLPLCISSLIVYLIKGSLQMFDSLQIGVGFVVGGIVGALLLKKISNAWLGIIFSLIIIAGGIKVLI